MRSAMRIGCLAFVLVCALPSRISLAQQPEASDSAIPPLGLPRPLVLPPVQQETLPNGLKLVVLEDHRQPALWLRLALPAGSIRDPQDRVGLAQMTADLLDKGTATRSETQIADTVDGLGATLSAEAGKDFLTVAASGLSPYADTLFDLLADITLHPTFPTAELERSRTQTLNELIQNLSQPSTMAGAALNRLIYGAYPYGNFAQGTPKTLAAIMQQDLIRFHDTYFEPNDSVLFVVGDITAAQVREKAQQYFGSWARKELPSLPSPPASAATSASRPQITLIDRPGSAQTEIDIGTLTSGYNSPQRIPGTVATAVLGMGQFEGRLTREIRVKRGLTYSVFSYFDRRKEAGEFEISTFTKNASTGEVVKLALDEANKMTGEDVGSEELTDRKTYLTGSFDVSVATPDGMLLYLIPAVLYGNGPSDLTAYTERVQVVTPQQIRDVMSGLGLSHLQVVLVGDAKAIQSQVAPLGDVTVIPFDAVDLLSPTLRGAAQASAGSAAPTPDELAAGKARLADVIKAMGGDAFLNVKTVQMKGKGALVPPNAQAADRVQIDMATLTVATPDKTRLDLSTGFGEFSLGIPGEGAAPWFSRMGSAGDAPPLFAQLAAALNPIRLLRDAAQKGYTVSTLPDGANGKPVTGPDGKPLAGLTITDGQGKLTQVYVDSETHLVRRLVIPNPGADWAITFSDYHAADNGVQLPGAVKVDHGSTTFVDLTFDIFKVNQPVDANFFARPKS